MASAVRIGTRASALAMKQAEWLVDQLAKGLQPLGNVEIVPITTSGDQDTQTPLHKLGDKGIFIKEIEEALMAKKIDVAVHSAKDLPSQQEEAFELTAFCGVQSAGDVLVFNSRFKKLPEMLEDLPLPHTARIATGSLRRTAQLKLLRSDLQVSDLRGNVQTRLKKLNDFDAIVLAKAGLERLGLISEYLIYEIPLDVMLPAVGQGVLALETRADDKETQKAIKFLDDAIVRIRLEAEREFLKLLQGGCQTPMACYANVQGQKIHMSGFVGTRDGKQSLRKEIDGGIKNPKEVGQKLAEEFLMAGVSKILEAEKSLGANS